MKWKDERESKEYCPKGKELAKRIAEVQAGWSEKDRERKDQYLRTIKPVRFRTFAPTFEGMKQID